MTGGIQVPERYLLPAESGVIVPARVAALLYRRTAISELRIANRGADPEVDAVLMALSLSAMHWLASVGGTDQRNPTEVEPPSEWMTTTDAATALDVSTSWIRQQCRDGHLPAEQQGRPHGWRIRREDFEHYRAARAA